MQDFQAAMGYGWQNSEGAKVSERVTIKSIADHLGISHMTVSRALSENPNVHPETRRAVRERAAALGYVKSAAAAAMRGEATRILGLVLPDLTEPFHAALADALARCCAGAGLHLIVHLTDADPAREQAAQHGLREMQARAAILLGASQGGEAPVPDHPGGMPLFRLTAPDLWFDDTAAITDAVAHLAAQGHRHIAFLGKAAGSSASDAFRSAIRDAGLSANAALILTGAASFRMGHDSALSLLDGAAPLSAILCGDAAISDGALAACLERGLSMPTDLAFVAYGDAPAHRWIGGGVSAIGLPAVDLAQRAFALATGAHPGPAEPAGFIRRASA